MDRKDNDRTEIDILIKGKTGEKEWRKIEIGGTGGGSSHELS